MRLGGVGRPQPKSTGYVVERRGPGLLSCLPEHLPTEDLLEITTIADRWVKYLDTRTGHMHDSEAYYKQMLEEQKDDQC